MNIDSVVLHRLSQAQSYYDMAGFKNIEVPWFVDKSIIDITLPPGATPVEIPGRGYLIGSAEQGFLSLIAEGKLPSGKYQSTSPCFRNDSVDELHRTAFMKLELIDTRVLENITTDVQLKSVIQLAELFFESCVGVEILQTEDGFDIVDSKNKIELGSYGIRSHPLVGTWIYGTGVAEPRLSAVLKMQKK